MRPMLGASLPSGLIAWFAANPIAANLLMLLILFGGAGSLLLMDKEVFPRFMPHQIEVRAIYPGAGPLELEESVCIRIEEAIYSLSGVKQLKTAIIEGECLVKVMVLPNYDKNQVMNAVQGRVQAIQRLPKGLEKIEVLPGNRIGDDGVIWVALHGPTDALTLKRLSDRIQGDLSQIPGVTRAHNYYDLPYEIAIEVSSERLRQFRVSLNEVTETIRRASVDLPGGVIKNPMGELLLRVKGRAQDDVSVGNLVVRTNSDGSRVLLRDVAVIKDGLEERLSEWHHNGETAQGWEIHAEKDSVAVARRVKAYVAEMKTQLPQGVGLITWWDDSQAYEERIGTLLEDGLTGFVLVCLILTLFLQLKVAIWAGIGILTSIFGAFWLMPALDVSLNMLSLFGFLLAMGILVDDAIIIGESIYAKQEAADAAGSPGSGTGQPLMAGAMRNLAYLEAAISGAREVSLPVIIAVMIVLVAFLPGLFLPGWAGQMMKPICVVMILTLVFSLIEALLILPSHLAVPSKPNASYTPLLRVRTALNQGLQRFIHRVYGPLLKKALAWRYLTVAAFAVLMMLASALVAGGYVRLSLQADVTKDSFWVTLKLPKDLPYSETRRIAEKVERALMEVQSELDKEARIRDPDMQESVIVGVETIITEHEAGFWTELSPAGRKHIVVEDFIREWRKRIGDIGRAKIEFLYKEGDLPYDIEFDLGHPDPATLAVAAAQFKQKLAGYPGVYDVVDSAEPGKPEVRLRLKPEAEHLGLRLEDVAEQMRHAYHGDEVHRLQRGRNEVKVIVRLPRSERESLHDMQSLPIRLPNGAQAPLGTLAEIDVVAGQSLLIRQDRQRILKIQAQIDPDVTDVNAVHNGLAAEEILQLKQQFPGLDVNIGEERQEQEETAQTLLFLTAIALTVIYALIAIPFQSYVKPLIFLLGAPVAWSGAVWAHWLLGFTVSMESLVGMIAASGVVVNDSLVLLDYVHKRGDSDEPTANLILEACTARFRPILLAFLTNFVGFLPILLETSEQAQFLVPMTLSLTVGLMIGMTASLILTPVCYAIVEKS
ncbi:multidrug efflux pump subunit AcrB [Nitrosospira sp. Nsp5]|uniref:Multidrug efflux pump subunit AcrB n=2 Tax=Nitrosomonadaceae TaxID=206379 RepID=A0ABY0TC83_9PROT|nr:multidrug efflux pump subunit AcrB [Nitrosospira sp. Nsp5]SDQ61031.1 Multidrug efflux pump subunit AcrB [Nitrosospira multiformis]